VIREFRLIDDVARAIRPLLTWTPDGNGIVYAAQDDALERASLYVTDLDGKSRRKWIGSSETSTGPACPSFSPDGKRFAYTEVYGPYQTRLFVAAVGPGMAPGGASPVTEPVPSLITYRPTANGFGSCRIRRSLNGRQAGLPGRIPDTQGWR
jgi:Tol biopolymer transport system component